MKEWNSSLLIYRAHIKSVLDALEKNRRNIIDLIEETQTNYAGSEELFNSIIATNVQFLRQIEEMCQQYREFYVRLDEYIGHHESVSNFIGDENRFTVSNLFEYEFRENPNMELTFNHLEPFFDKQQVDPVVCKMCGASLYPGTRFCVKCGSRIPGVYEQVQLDQVQFSAIAPESFTRGNYSMIDIYMYEEAFRRVVEDAIENADEAVREKRSGILEVSKNAKISVVLSSPDLIIEGNKEEQIWHGKYLNFSFPLEIPENYEKKQILFLATVYINDVIATKLKFIAKCDDSQKQKVDIAREDIFSAFISYASEDRSRVAAIIQGMKKARPDLDIFFDVDSLRSGEDWEKAMWQEIDKRDVLFLCWSKYARESKWVEAEWRYALKQKGIESIEPVPIDSPSSCPPPRELAKMHFNDKLLYIINSKEKYGYTR